MMRILYKLSLLLSLSLVVTSCATRSHLKNLLNIPTELASLRSMDSLRVQPDIVRLSDGVDTLHLTLSRDVRISGKPDNRAVWVGGEEGALIIDQGARVILTDINFRNPTSNKPLILVRHGQLTLENCDITDLGSHAIQVDSLANLSLKNVRFMGIAGHAVISKGQYLRVFGSTFVACGPAALKIGGGRLLEIHGSDFQRNLGSGIEIHGVHEILLDSVRVAESFEDGIRMSDCGYVLLESVETIKNGRHGYNIENSKILGQLNCLSTGNLVNGLISQNVDTLHLVNSEFLGNGQTGLSIKGLKEAKLGGLSVAYNGYDGVSLANGNSLTMEQSNFQVNRNAAVRVENLKTVLIEKIAALGSKSAMMISQVDTLTLLSNLIRSHAENGLFLDEGERMIFRSNQIEKSQRGIFVKNSAFVQMDSNTVRNNLVGATFRSSGTINLANNMWTGNETGVTGTGLVFLESNSDTWTDNRAVGLEVTDGSDLLLSNGLWSRNNQHIILHQSSTRLENSRLDTCVGQAIKVSNGRLSISQSHFIRNSVALDIGSGSQSSLVQSDFTNCDISIRVGESSKLSMNFSRVRDGHLGLDIKSYSDVELISNQFIRLGGEAIKVSGPHLQRLYLRQNVFAENNSIIYSAAVSGEIQIVNNTFVNNSGGLQMKPGTVTGFNYNIYTRMPVFDSTILEYPDRAANNCYDSKMIEAQKHQLLAKNIFGKPLLDENYHPLPDSPCIEGGENGTLIGALGVSRDPKLTLKP